MINVNKSIATKLKKTFPNIPIYLEKQRKGFEEPCFYINKITTNSNPLLFSQQYRNYQYQLVYFPDPKHVNLDIENMEDMLLSNFTNLDLGTVRNRDFQKQDDVLLFTFSVDIIAKPVDEDIKQQNMKYKGDV